MSLSHGAGHHQYRELHAGGGGISSGGGSGNGSFPLGPDFFRSLPLSRRARDELYAEAKQNARACLRLAFNDQWRYVPPEKDGAQVRKDTSNLAESRRLVRAAAVLRCQEHEVGQVLANTSSASWREFARKCCGKYLVDSLILHTVRSPSSSSSSRAASATSSRAANEGSGSDADDEAGRASHWQGGNNNHEHDNCRVPVRLVDDDCLSASGGATPKRLERRSSEVCAADMRARAYHNRWTSSRRHHNSASNQDEGGAASDPDGLGEDADELLTVKWGVFETGVSGKRDLCLVDYLSLAFMPSDDDDDGQGAMTTEEATDNDAACTRERVHVWCFTSTDGERVGCMQLKDTHGVRRASLSRFGVFWRRHSDGETEVVVCGSFPSKHAPAATAILLLCLSRLQSIVEDLRLSCQVYLPRSAWVNDRERSSCRLCMRNFFALRRKHHCPRCGEVVCSDCSTVESVDRPGIGYAKIRMCKVCCLRARSTPLRQVGRENVFDRLVRVRSASGLARRSPRHSGSDNTLLLCGRTSFSESKRSDRYDAGNYSGSSSSGGGSDNVPASAAAMAHASRPHSSGNNQSSDDERYDFADSGVSSLGGRTTAGVSAVVHPMPPAEPDDFIDARCLKRQLTAMEAKKEQQTQHADKGGDMFDLLCELACQTLSCPIASVSIVDDRGEYIRSAAGLEGKPELDRELGVFLDKVMGATPAIVLDANVDAQTRLAFPPQAPPAIRFFAGSPIYSRAGRKLGYVCVADTTKRDTLGASCAFTMERNASAAKHAGGAPSNQAADESERHHARFTTAKAPGLASDVEIVDSELVYDLAPAAKGAGPAAATAPNMPPGDYDGGAGDAQERMRKLLLKSYHTQQQLAASNSPKVRLTPPF